ncbi:fasciclin-like arabinogalactan protein 2 [Iris pallida]|uniref:Fasciclin-like arabinogalactan protein 2 n=1 Tax=Iris pallida TaxID=29817 RepID=A0AAX6HTN4_IRIPA|nr:fasciclin-like arabinogalactan protein 2 [Iris pallida]
MSKKGCKTFADLLTSGTAPPPRPSKARGRGPDDIRPIDQAMRAFLPKFNKLPAPTNGVLLYHGVPAYESLDLLSPTAAHEHAAATTGPDDEEELPRDVQNVGSVVTLRTKVTKASITGTWSTRTRWRSIRSTRCSSRGSCSACSEGARPAPALAPSGAPAGPKSNKKRRRPEEETTPRRCPRRLRQGRRASRMI